MGKPTKPATGRAVTIKDVAREAGVSAMSVSNVLNGRGRISEATANHIREVVERLGYRPSVAARRLRLSQQWTIGMLIVVEDPDFLSDLFITAQVTGLTNYLTANSYSLILRGMKPSDFRTTGLFQDIEADGMVAILSGDRVQRDWFVRELSALRVPLVLLQEHHLPDQPDCAIISQDDFDGGRQVGRHLVERGVRSGWMLMPHVEWPAMRARMDGAASAFADAGLPELRIVDCGDESFDVSYQATLAALEAGPVPDAIIGGNDQMAIAAIKACRATGLRVPEEIQITGFNAFEIWRYVDPILTTVRSAAHALGERAAKELIARLQAGHFKKREIVLPVDFQPGKSTRMPS
ncbi:LacI family DNA-binding transcriptional regulator [Microbaculum marinisediminis]|uniref:LacI family transcriptional regulator n=1 Tax=Microbaculum marinisediminis TaxID=2931392 RepID=A0AAW5QYE1_9HYPH|nr:LacI family DNA-binding transcriptional regulator [Microbaculum sp. A6E488]MCT8972947.1 LacI family transcriptional regulator [Microbaculum sp. A6E488]